MVVIGDLFLTEKKRVLRNFEVQPFPEKLAGAIEILRSRKGKKPLFLYLEEASGYTPGVPLAELGGRSFEYFYRAMQVVKALGNASLVTLPVSKELICRSGRKFYGHTEELERFFGVPTVMCMYHPELSIIPLTHHIPLKTVAARIKKIDWKSLSNAVRFLKEMTRFSRKIAMTGLNPHAGENGEIGDEEEILSAAIKGMAKDGIDVVGPLPADGLFMPANRVKYSLVIAAYHDQALIPFKALYGTAGLNITLNLPCLRVSPDHGPAYEFAGKSKADMQSVYKSIVFAMETGEKWIKLYSSR